jgi:uncharacterized Rmd1/YagE family protein
MKPLLDMLKGKFHHTTSWRDLVHVEVPLEEGSGDLFIFSYGTVVSWKLTKEMVLGMINHDLKPFEINSAEEIESDELVFTYGETPKLVDDEIIVPNHDVLTKVALSYGLAQSVKLGTFETQLLKTFNKTRHIPEELVSKGKISLSRVEIRRKMGELFIERSAINLHLDALDVPDFFWEYPELEPLYKMVIAYLDVQTRSEVLNKRLNIVHELFEVLGNELNHQHSSRLELTIILLIVIEVVMSLMRDVFRMF